jgi:hypothetical protein
LFADRGFGGLSLAGGGGLPTRLAGGTLALTVLGTAIVGLMLGTRTGRLYERFQAEAVDLARAALSARMDGVARQLAWSVARSEEEQDWSPLQALLPSLTQGDPELSSIVVTDEDGLVVAASDPKENGLPLASPQLRALLPKPPAAVRDVALVDGAALARVEHAGSGRIVWVVARLTRAEAARASIARAAHEAVRLGWVLVTLGGLVVALVAVGAVALVGRSLARGLSAISWRVGQLGLGDRSTHLSLDGPGELRQIGLELERAARRIEASEALRLNELRSDAILALHRSLSDAALAASVDHAKLGGLELGHALGAAPLALTLGARAGDQHALAWLVEVVSKAPADLLTATAYGAQASVLARDAACAPASLLAGLDRSGPHARAATLSILDGGARVRIAVAGARFPLLHRAGAARVEVVVARGDRLGETNAVRGDEVEVKLGAGDALYLYCDPAPTPAAVGGHVPRGLDAQLASVAGDARQRATALVGLGLGAAYVFLRPA